MGESLGEVERKLPKEKRKLRDTVVRPFLGLGTTRNDLNFDNGERTYRKSLQNPSNEVYASVISPIYMRKLRN
jgi:hypothetical protein